MKSCDPRSKVGRVRKPTKEEEETGGIEPPGVPSHEPVEEKKPVLIREPPKLDQSTKVYGRYTILKGLHIEVGSEIGSEVYMYRLTDES